MLRKSIILLLLLLVAGTHLLAQQPNSVWAGTWIYRETMDGSLERLSGQIPATIQFQQWNPFTARWQNDGHPRTIWVNNGFFNEWHYSGSGQFRFRIQVMNHIGYYHVNTPNKIIIPFWHGPPICVVPILPPQWTPLGNP